MPEAVPPWLAAKLHLSADEISRINGLDRHHRCVDGSFWELPGGP